MDAPLKRKAEIFHSYHGFKRTYSLKSAPSCVDGNLQCLCSRPYVLSSSLLLLPVSTELRAIRQLFLEDEIMAENKV